MATTRGYHFNPETGRTGKCDAEIKCRFADSFDGEPPHFATADEARAAYEAYTGETKGWFADAVKNCQKALEDDSSVGNHEAGDDAKADESPEQDLPVTSESDLNHQTFAEHDGPSSYTVPAGAVNDARKLIDRANKKLERAGISERFEVTEEPISVEFVNGRGFKEKRDYVVMHLNHPSISYAGYKFLAVIDKEDNGLIVRTGHNVELNGWRPESQACEHCGQKRHRSKTYLVEGPDGERHQIGSTCVEAYLGVKPEGLWTVGSNPLKKMDRDNVGYSGGFTPSIREVIGLSLALSNNGEKFTSKSKAMDYGTNSTADDVELFMSSPRGAAGASERARIARLAEQYEADGSVDRVLKAAREIDGNNDYCANLRTIANNDYVTSRSLGIAVSAVGVDFRNRQKASKPKGWASGFMADVGTKVSGRKLTVVRNKQVDNWQYNKTQSYITLKDDEGHQVFWRASKYIDLKAGEEVELTGGTVKSHGKNKYDDSDQTVLTRVKFNNLSR